jgi:tRNA pseudouridine38-40 synthase
MVRIMVGTLLFVNEGKIKQGELIDVINSKQRNKAGKTAPPQGLYLNAVNY